MYNIINASWLMGVLLRSRFLGTDADIVALI